MYIITSRVNQYDQYGDYFETAYTNKPTLEQLIKFFKDEKLAAHVFNGGGRIGVEDLWYHLTEIQDGEQYEEKQ